MDILWLNLHVDAGLSNCSVNKPLDRKAMIKRGISSPSDIWPMGPQAPGQTSPVTHSSWLAVQRAAALDPLNGTQTRQAKMQINTPHRGEDLIEAYD